MRIGESVGQPAKRSGVVNSYLPANLQPAFAGRLVQPGPHPDLFAKALEHVTHQRTQWNYQILRIRPENDASYPITIVARALDETMNPYREIQLEETASWRRKITVTLRNHSRFELNTYWGITANINDWLRTDSREAITKAHQAADILKSIAR